MIPVATNPCRAAKTLKICVHHSHQGLGLGVGAPIRSAEAYLGHLAHLVLLGIEWSWVVVVLVILIVELYHHEGSEP